jgi:hypothetical protein
MRKRYREKILRKDTEVPDEIPEILRSRKGYSGERPGARKAQETEPTRREQ